MNYRFVDLVDLHALDEMLASFYRATGIMYGLVDDRNEVIGAIGWQQACTEFHRASPVALERCLETNRYLADHVQVGAYACCKCKNGLMDYAVAIDVEGKQLATLYFGQVLHEPPDLDFFRRQAQECGFDQEAYLAAIAKLPIVPKERVESIMAFYGQLAQMLARAGLERLRQRQLSDQLRELAARRETIREDERKRIGREIHEELAQYLSALKLQVTGLRMEIGSKGSALADRTAVVAALVDKTLQIVRGVSVAVRPPVLDNGVAAALEWLGAQFATDSGVRCQVCVPQTPLALDETQAAVLFRIVKEALDNVADHASAENVVVTLVEQDGNCVVKVRDDGRGFDVSIRDKGSLGIVAMSEWALAVGGQIAIDSVPDHGTEISIAIPAPA